MKERVPEVRELDSVTLTNFLQEIRQRHRIKTAR